MLTPNDPSSPPAYENFAREHASRLDAFTAYGAAQSEYYEQLLNASNKPHCVICCRAGAKAIAEFSWTARITTGRSLRKGGALAIVSALISGALLGHAHAATHALQEEHSFDTRHPCCRDCFLAWQRRGRTMKVLANTSLVVTLLTSLPAIMFLMIGYFGKMKTSELQTLRLWGFVAAIIAMAGIIMYAFARPATAPPALRHLLEARTTIGNPRLTQVLTQPVAAIPRGKSNRL